VSKKDLTGEREAAAEDLRRHCENIGTSAAELVRSDFGTEFNGIMQQVDRMCTCLREEDHKLREQQMRSAGEEVRNTLIAHREFAEALEREQRQLIERLNEGLAREANQRAELEPRLRWLETDLGKVRGHLPILFTHPTPCH